MPTDGTEYTPTVVIPVRCSTRDVCDPQRIPDYSGRATQYDWTNRFSGFHTLSEADDTWKFWARFVLEDCQAYVGLILAMRCQNWNLRVSSLMKMAPLFAAYDHTTYQRLIPNHLADIQTYPAQVLWCMQTGAFAVSVKVFRGHSVALD